MHVQVQLQPLHFTYPKATPVTLHPQNAAVITEKVRKFYEASFQVQFQLQMQVQLQVKEQVSSSGAVLSLGLSSGAAPMFQFRHANVYV